MMILNDKDIFVGGLTGISMHTIMWFTQVNILNLRCIGGCESLMLFDIPASLFYFFMSEPFQLLLSFILGGVQWGLGGWLGIKFLKYIEKQNRKK